MKKFNKIILVILLFGISKTTLNSKYRDIANEKSQGLIRQSISSSQIYSSPMRLLPHRRETLMKIRLIRIKQQEQNLQEYALKLIATNDLSGEVLFLSNKNINNLLLYFIINSNKTTQYLNIIYLSNNNLRSLPENFDLLPKSITIIDLNNNPLGETSNPISNLGVFYHLQILKLNNCELNSLPNEIGQLQQLKEIHLSNNCFEKFPIIIFNLKGIGLIDLSKNKLIELPKKIGVLINLMVLRIQDNTIITLPREIENCTRLWCLEVSGNLFHTISNLTISTEEGFERNDGVITMNRNAVSKYLDYFK